MSSGPLLHLKKESEPVSGQSIHALVDLLVEIEQRLAAGPWDSWDAVALEQCREVVRRRLREAYNAVDERP